MHLVDGKLLVEDLSRMVLQGTRLWETERDPVVSSGSRCHSSICAQRPSYRQDETRRVRVQS
jgi:hypothetical protein